jgi:hypothetical protein
MDIWAACKDELVQTTLEGEVIRFVESQEQIATNAIVDTLDEQSQLEGLLEKSKPPLFPGTTGLHYLLATPFRYPPLKQGSRFGTRMESSLFYGSIDLSAALSETAYYRFVFWKGMENPPPSGKFTTEHTLFGASYRTKKGLQLQNNPFIPYQDILQSPNDYNDTQQLGVNIRAEGIQGFEYVSARDPDKGLNIGIIKPDIFSKATPSWQEAWICDTRENEVSFFSKGKSPSVHKLESFLIDEMLPIPAL